MCKCHRANLQVEFRYEFYCCVALHKLYECVKILSCYHIHMAISNRMRENSVSFNAFRFGIISIADVCAVQPDTVIMPTEKNQLTSNTHSYTTITSAFVLMRCLYHRFICSFSSIFWLNVLILYASTHSQHNFKCSACSTWDKNHLCCPSNLAYRNRCQWIHLEIYV